MPDGKKLTELENAVLGVVWRRGPCSAYVVQANFDLVSAAWTASPGSVYPLMRKLCARGLLAKQEQSWGRGSKSLYALTVAGRACLSQWVETVPDWAGKPSADPLRTRSFFMDALRSDAERLAFLDRAEAATREALTRFEARAGASDALDDPLERLGRLGGILQLRARLEWIGRVREYVSGRGPGKTPASSG